MSSYPPPTNWTQNPFNPINWPSYSDYLSIANANKRYLIKIGNDTDYGNLTLRQNLYFTDSNLAIYRAGTNDLRISTAGIDRIHQTNTSTRINQPLLLSDGTSSNPSYSFVNETSLGWYRAGSGDIRLSQSGIDVLTYSGAQFLVNGRQRTTISGTASNPSIKIGTDDTLMTGFYNNGIYALTASVGQQAVADFRNSGGRGIRLYGDTTTGNNALYSPSILGYYEELDHSTTFTGGNATTVSITCKLRRIGNLVTFYMPSWGSSYTNTNGSAVSYSMNTAFPLRFQPPTFIGALCVAFLNSNRVAALSYINATSGVVILEQSTAPVPNNQSWQMLGFSLTWAI